MLKERARAGWTPEYRPESHVPMSKEHHAHTVTERSTRVTIDMIMKNPGNMCVLVFSRAAAAQHGG